MQWGSVELVDSFYSSGYLTLNPYCTVSMTECKSISKVQTVSAKVRQNKENPGSIFIDKAGSGYGKHQQRGKKQNPTEAEQKSKSKVKRVIRKTRGMSQSANKDKTQSTWYTREVKTSQSAFSKACP